MKGLSLSIQFEIVKRERLYYNQFQYCVSGRMSEAHIVRRVDHAHVDSRIDRRNSLSLQYGGQYVSHISEQERENLHEYVDVLMSAITPYRTSVTGDWFYVYTNDCHLCESIRKLSFVSHITGSRVTVIDIPEDSIVRKRSKYSHRTYFRNRRLSARDQDSLIAFIKHQEDDVQLSPRMKWWIESGMHLNLWTGYFIDHNDDGVRMMIELIAPGSTKKTVSILRDK